MHMSIQCCTVGRNVLFCQNQTNKQALHILDHFRLLFINVHSFLLRLLLSKFNSKPHRTSLRHWSLLNHPRHHLPIISHRRHPQAHGAHDTHLFRPAVGLHVEQVRPRLLIDAPGVQHWELQAALGVHLAADLAGRLAVVVGKFIMVPWKKGEFNGSDHQ